MEASLLELNEPEAFTVGVQVNSNVEFLLRQILGHLNGKVTSNDPSQKNTDFQEVIFDLYLDGTRYVLIRCYPQSSQLGVTLSPREQEIVRLITKGFPNKSIAAVLDISPWTVSTHLRRVFVKLGVCSRAEMVAQALKEGLLRSED